VATAPAFQAGYQRGFESHQLLQFRNLMRKLALFLFCFLVSTTAFAGAGKPTHTGGGGINGRTMITSPGEGRPV
jgi:hypothetical protein